MKMSFKTKLINFVMAFTSITTLFLVRYGIPLWHGTVSVQGKSKLAHLVRSAMKVMGGLKTSPSSPFMSCL